MDQNTSISIPFDVDVSGDPNSTINLDLEPYNFTYTHPIGAPPITDLLIWGTFTPDNPEPTNGEGLEFYMDNISVTSSCNSQIQITHTVKSQCIGGQAVIEYEVCLLGPGTAPVTVNLQADIPQGLTVVSGGGFDPNGLATFQLTPGTECNGGPNTYIITLTMNVSPNFDPAQAPIPVGVPLEFVGTGLCIDPATGHGGDVTLMLQDCLPAAACFCPPNTGPPPIGNNMDSETTFSTSGLPSTLENSCLSVNGRLYVDKNFTIKNTHVIMNRGAEIVVKDKAKLEVTDFSILEGCEHMWRGITVENGGILAMTDNSQVLDAQWAIQAMSGSTIEVTDCYFDRDYAGIHVPVSANGAAQTVNVVAITGNQFATWSALKPAYTVTGDSDHEQDPIPGVYTYTGISLNDVVGFDIGAGNKFDEVRNAVFALRSGFTMEHCTIRNLVADPADLNGNPYFNVDQHGVYADYCPLAKVTYCSFLNFGKGIFSQASNITADFNTMAGFNFDSPEDDMGIQCELNTNKSVRVRNNTISAWGTGIYVSNALPATILRIKGNILTMYPGSPGQHIDMQSIRWGLVAGNTMTRSHASATGFGISMLSCSSITVEGNDMFGLQRGTSTQGCVGNIFTVNDAVDGGLRGYTAFNSTDTYCSNKSEGQSEYGFYFEGMCIKANALLCNNINDAGDDGLNLWANGLNSTKIGTQTNGGNKWLGAYGGWGAYNESANQFDILESRFSIPINQTPTWSTGLGQNVAWFQPFIGTPINCLTACPLTIDTDDYPTGGGGVGYGQGDLGDEDIKSAQGGHYGNGFNWMARQRLYERLRQYPALAAQNPYVQQFYTTAPYTDLGQLSEVGSDLALLQGRDAYTFAALGDLQKEIASLSDVLQALRATGPGNDYAAWWLQVRQQQQQVRQATNRLRGHEKWLSERRQEEASAILAENAGVATSNICATNQQAINAIYLSNALWEDNPLDAVTLQQVKAIADQCPLEGGFAVYEARGLYRRFVPLATWSQNAGCSGLRPAGRSAFGQEGVALEFRLLPNPADETLNLTSASENKAVRLQLYSMTGGLLLSEMIESSPSGQLVNVSNLPSGMYFYRILHQEKSVQSGKVVISH